MLKHVIAKINVNKNIIFLLIINNLLKVIHKIYEFNYIIEIFYLLYSKRLLTIFSIKTQLY